MSIKSAADMITTVESWDVDKMSYGPTKVNQRGGKSIKILDGNRNPLMLEAPLMLTWGINKMVDDDTGRVSYNMSLQFPSEDYSSPTVSSFLEKMKDMENRILDDAVAKSKDWFGKSGQIRQVAEALFTPILKYPKDKETGEPDYDRSPNFRVKIPYWEGKFNVELYDMDGGLMFDGDTMSDSADRPFETYVPKGSHVATMLQCNGLWFAAGKFGVTWKLVQAIVRSPVRIKGRCFISMNSSDRAQQLANAEKVEASLKSRGEIEDDGEDDGEVVDTTVQDSDDEEEEQQPAREPTPEPEPEPAPKKITKKKVTKKRVTKKKE